MRQKHSLKVYKNYREKMVDATNNKIKALCINTT
jgi:hypothetical protein